MCCVVSCFGAHFAEAQLALAARYTNRVAVLFDDDTAGRDGADAALAKCSVHGDLAVRKVIGVLGGQDLDEFIRAGGDWRGLVDRLRADAVTTTAEDALRRRLANA
jgi:DNA primase